ncbi:PQQ-binding-like beta-propeller repeat protein [Deinococcus saxicola]|uniref:outer membrane protein assembly factor BamB family protein n=1 Tax=Deinococcus saxicola TaxID=249406 RepID=UPI0039EE1A5D
MKKSILYSSLLALTTLAAAQTAGNDSSVGGMGLSNAHAGTGGLNAQNVDKLKLAWKFQAPGYVSHSPLVEGGQVYFADWSGNAYAVNAASGQLTWKKSLEQPVKAFPWHGFAGTGALGQGMLFEASVEGYAFGLDRTTGEVKWKTDFVPESQYGGSISTLLYHGGLVYIGVSSVEEAVAGAMKRAGKPFAPSFRGKVVALDAASGKIVWEKSLVPAPGNGVAMWGSFALDPASNTLFFATGNNYSGKSTDLSDSIVAVNGKTGETVWATQATAFDVWTPATPTGPDVDFAAGPNLFSAQVGGQSRDFVGIGQKNGIYWALDRRSGEIVWKHTVGYSGVGGGVRAEASVAGGKVYVWSNNSFDDTTQLNPAEFPINVKAIDGGSGSLIWARPKVMAAGATGAGYLSNDIYLVGTLSGLIKAFRTSDGQVVWTSGSHPSIASSLVVSGDQLFFGTGVPARFSGQGEGMIYAYTTR